MHDDFSFFRAKRGENFDCAAISKNANLLINVFQKMYFFGHGQDFPFEPPRKAWNYFCSSRGSRAAGRVLDFILLESRVEPDGRLEIISLESRVAPGSSGFSGAQFC